MFHLLNLKTALLSLGYAMGLYLLTLFSLQPPEHIEYAALVIGGSFLIEGGYPYYLLRFRKRELLVFLAISKFPCE